MKKVKIKELKSITIDIKKDLENPYKLPWPLKSNSVSEISCISIFEFVPGKNRGAFADEIYRVLIPGGKAVFKVPYWNTYAAIQDYAVEWPPLCEASFCYFDKSQRESIGLTQEIRPLLCDFEVGFGYDVPPEIAGKNDETRSFSIKHYANVINCLNVVLTKREKK
jgi:hypothetical protein